jgi:hypothetical protein
MFLATGVGAARIEDSVTTSIASNCALDALTIGCNKVAYYF